MSDIDRIVRLNALVIGDPRDGKVRLSGRAEGMMIAYDAGAADLLYIAERAIAGARQLMAPKHPAERRLPDEGQS